MPNGHGGVPRFGAPTIILGIASALFLSEAVVASAYFRPALMVLAAGFGWKLAVHVHYWHVLEYGGAKVTPEEETGARIKMVLGAVLYTAIAGLCALLLTD